ncbi:MAG: CBS domain-containing protein [Anaerolineae bacterium]
MEAIFTHPSADFDAVAALLAAHKLYPDALPVLPHKLNHNVSEFITLYQNGLPFLHWDDVKGRDITRVILVDTQRLPEMKGLRADLPVRIFDHHPRRQDLGDHVSAVVEDLGAITTLLVEDIQAHGLTLNSLEATLLALGIYSDTGSLTYGRTTPRDIRAAAWLIEQRAVLDTVRDFLVTPLNDLQQLLLDKLVKSAESRSIEGLIVVICTAEVREYIEQINSVTQRVNDILDPDALLVLVNMRGVVQMVARSGREAIDVAVLAREFGGGGHPRAAAAKIMRKNLNDIKTRLWALLEAQIQPSTRVADLMSYGVQTVQADAPLTSIIQQMRRIGHEGYPVVDEGRLVGLLTRRDADRALEHGLANAIVRDVMLSGEVSLTPDDSVSTLEQLMVQSGWGQIPVVNGRGHLTGIVTRTDLIKHWVQTHPTSPPPQDRIPPAQVQAVLGETVAGLIETVSAQARAQNISVYMVGGVVRDLILQRPNYDIDFVVEGDAIAFAETLQAEFGGDLVSFRPFGTAKWRLAESSLAHEALPDHIDFATSRNEFYEHPTALPSVYNSSIKLDLHRRDFTINTLAVQLSPERSRDRLLDFYGGLDDLRNGIIRVLHSLSFVDDPTRVLRAIRFAQRLKFTIEPRTWELIAHSAEMLRRITGERVRNELALLLKEAEPEKGLAWMEQQGILQAIHPDFKPGERAWSVLAAIRELEHWPTQPEDRIELTWHVVMMSLPPERIPAVGERLLFGKPLVKSFGQAAALVQPDMAQALNRAEVRVSEVVHTLDDYTETALLAAYLWLLAGGELVYAEHIAHYLREWRHIQPASDGNTLIAMGLRPGPRFRRLLTRLRAALLDGEISTVEDEARLLERMIKDETDGGAG